MIFNSKENWHVSDSYKLHMGINVMVRSEAKENQIKVLSHISIYRK